MGRIRVLKAAGEYEPFSEGKIRASLKKVGVDKEVAEEIVSQLQNELYGGIPTSEIHSKVLKLLKKQRSPATLEYNLRRAVMQLGPTGYPFERFFAGVLRYLGYRAKTNCEVVGRCIKHEIDIAAEKEGKRCMVECKFHHKKGVRTDSKDALYTYGRFLDVRDSFDEAWLVTNTKVPASVKKYGKCVGLRVTSWDYPPGRSLCAIIEKTGLHPVTALTTISSAQKRDLLEQGIVFCRDLTERKLTLLPKNKQSAVKAEIAWLSN